MRRSLSFLVLSGLLGSYLAAQATADESKTIVRTEEGVLGLLSCPGVFENEAVMGATGFVSYTSKGVFCQVNGWCWGNPPRYLVNFMVHIPGISNQKQCREKALEIWQARSPLTIQECMALQTCETF